MQLNKMLLVFIETTLVWSAYAKVFQRIARILPSEGWRLYENSLKTGCFHALGIL
jgi:hypothetical protein